MKSFIILTLLLTPYFLPAQDVNKIIKEGVELESALNDELALKKYLQALQVQSNNLFASCKASELYSRIGARRKDESERVKYFSLAKSYAQESLKIDSLDSESNFVMALVMGRDAMQRGGKEKIAAVKDIKHYAENSIKYNPQNYKAWFILGKWYYEVSSLNYFERTAVKLFFGAFPDATINDAIKCLEKARSLNPQFALSYLSLAKAYKRNDNDLMARQTLSTMIRLPDTTQDDVSLKAEGKSLLKKWN